MATTKPVSKKPSKTDKTSSTNKEAKSNTKPKAIASKTTKASRGSEVNVKTKKEVTAAQPETTTQEAKTTTANKKAIKVDEPSKDTKPKLSPKGKPISLTQPSSAEPAPAKKIIVQRLDLYLDYEHRNPPVIAIPPSELPKLSLAQAQRLKIINEHSSFKEILTFTPAPVNLPIGAEFLEKNEKIAENMKPILISLLHAQDEILINAIHIYEGGNISLKTAESLKKFRVLKRKNVAALYNQVITWGQYNQQINKDLEAVER